jgi:hypothetical protein
MIVERATGHRYLLSYLPGPEKPRGSSFAWALCTHTHLCSFMGNQRLTRNSLVKSAVTEMMMTRLKSSACVDSASHLFAAFFIFFFFFFCFFFFFYLFFKIHPDVFLINFLFFRSHTQYVPRFKSLQRVQIQSKNLYSFFCFCFYLSARIHCGEGL